MTFDPKINLAAKYSEGLMNHGAATWLDTGRKPEAECRRRIFLATIDARLIAVDAASGKPCTDSGKAGEVDLTPGINAWGFSDAERNACRDRLARLRSGGIFTPPTVEGMAAVPGNLGGMNWSGGAFDRSIRSGRFLSPM